LFSISGWSVDGFKRTGQFKFTIATAGSALAFACHALSFGLLDDLLAYQNVFRMRPLKGDRAD
jgi:hypothetical protein